MNNTFARFHFVSCMRAYEHWNPQYGKSNNRSQFRWLDSIFYSAYMCVFELFFLFLSLSLWLLHSHSPWFNPMTVISYALRQNVN